MERLRESTIANALAIGFLIGMFVLNLVLRVWLAALIVVVISLPVVLSFLNKLMRSRGRSIAKEDLGFIYQITLGLPVALAIGLWILLIQNWIFGVLVILLTFIALGILVYRRIQTKGRTRESASTAAIDE